MQTGSAGPVAGIGVMVPAHCQFLSKDVFTDLSSTTHEEESGEPPILAGFNGTSHAPRSAGDGIRGLTPRHFLLPRRYAEVSVNKPRRYQRR
jgi:hypothetical protein